mgnify:CR=1 FL=1
MVEAVSLIVRVLARNGPVDRVNVWGVPAEEVKVRSLNSSSEFVVMKAIVPPVAESNSIDPEPLSHRALSVLELVHVPLTVHASEPKSIALEADEMLTAPVIVTAPLVLVRSPPDMVRDPADVIANVLFANVPPEIVSAFVMMTAEASVTVPPEMVKSSNVLSEERSVMVAVASNV